VKKVLKWLWMVLPVLLMGATHPSPTWNSGIETIKFRYGVLPDASYTSCTMTRVKQDSTTTNYSSRTNLRTGPTTGTSDDEYLLWKADISAIPDGAVIVDATLRLLVQSYGAGYSGVAIYDYIEAARVLFPYTLSEVTWAKRKGTPADTVWEGSTPFLNDYSYTMPSGAYGLSSTGLGFMSGQGNFPASNIGWAYKREAGIPTAVGTDSVFSGYGLTSLKAAVSRIDGCGSWFRPKATASASTAGWIELDVTKAVRMWHSNSWANHGLVIRPLPELQVATQQFTVRSHNYSTSAGRPMLIVRYLYATPGGGGGGRRGVGP
jgi:hypothetical protein